MNHCAKILLLCLDMDPYALQGDQHTGAAHLYVKETLETLAENNIPTLAITRWDSIGRPKTEQIGSVSIERVRIGAIDRQPKDFLWHRESETLTEIKACLEQRSFEPTIIHAVYCYSGTIMLRLKDAFPDARLAYTIVSLGKVKHAWKGSLTPHDIEREKTEQRLFECSDVIMAVSQQERDNVLRLYEDIDAAKLVVIGRGVDPCLFSPCFELSPLHPSAVCKADLYLLSSPQKALLFVGRLIRSKGYVELLRIYDRLLDNKTITVPPLWIVGGSREEVRRAWELGLTTPRLQQANSEGRIWWWGAVPREFMPLFYQRALVTCVPSHYEPGARVILESMACGTPVIMTPTGYCGELVQNGFNGFVADLHDERSWILYLTGLIKDRTWRDIISRRAYSSVLPYYSLECFKRRQWSIYEHLLDSTKPLSAPVPDFLQASSICPTWEIPPDYSADQSQLDATSLAAWYSQLTEKPEHSFVVETHQPSSASTKHYRIREGDDCYHVKQFLDKSHFFNLFWPVPVGAAYRDARARWCAEELFASDPLFLSPVASCEEMLFMVHETAATIPKRAWDYELILEAFELVREFHCRQAARFFKDLSSMYESLSTLKNQDWPSYLEQYDRIQQWNARFRGGSLWHSPALLTLELEVLKLGLEDDIWALPREVSSRILANANTLLASLDDEMSLNVVWGECRPDHFMMVGAERIKGIDPETIQLGEEEIDYSSFVWWWLDFRSHKPVPEAYVYLQGLFRAWKRSTVSKYRTLAWTWCQCIYWYLWDQIRGVIARSNNYLEFITEFDAISATILE